jgi:hypothetical protein
LEDRIGIAECAAYGMVSDRTIIVRLTVYFDGVDEGALRKANHRSRFWRSIEKRRDRCFLGIGDQTLCAAIKRRAIAICAGNRKPEIGN